MKLIGLSQAKAKLFEIADAVKRTGEPVTLIKYGKPHVDMVPHRDDGIRRPQSEVLADLERLRRQVSKSDVREIKAHIEEGRR